MLLKDKGFCNFSAEKVGRNDFCRIFAPTFTVLLTGLFGFDSGLRWYVSTRSVGGWLLNLSYQQINWQQSVCSRCLIEAQ